MAIYNITKEMEKETGSVVDGEKDESYGGVEEPLDKAFDVDKEEDFSFDYLNVSNFYDRVRLALNVKDSALPNEAIHYPENAPLAELHVKSKINEYEKMTEGKRLLYNSALVYMTCFNVCEVASNKQVKKQSTSSLTLEYSVNDSDSPKSRFLNLVDDLIAKINEEENYVFLGFAVTPSSDHCHCRKRRCLT